MRKHEFKQLAETDDNIKKAIAGMRDVLNVFDDPSREGLDETPLRYVKFMHEFLNPEPFEYSEFNAEGTDEMIVVSNIPFYSLCEHHMAPFFGYAAVAYIPNDKIVGLSKLPRVVDLYARKLQNQERITTQIAEELMKKLNPKGVAVLLKAKHLCVEMRGIKKHDCWTTTSKLMGVFKEEPETRKEFFDIIRKDGH